MRSQACLPINYDLGLVQTFEIIHAHACYVQYVMKLPDGALHIVHMAMLLAAQTQLKERQPIIVSSSSSKIEFIDL